MKTTFRILFLIRKSRLNKNGLSPIAVRITIGGNAVEFNSPLSVNPALWNPIGRMNGKTKEAIRINDALDKIRADLNAHHSQIFEKYGYVTPEKLRDSYLGVDIQRNTVLSLFESKVEQKRNLVGKTIRSTTLSKYLATRNRIAEFIKHQYDKDYLPVREVNFQFITDYEVYLKSLCECGHNSCVKHLRYLKQVITNALKNRIITADPFDEYKLGYKPVNKEYLIEPEIKRLLTHKFSAKRLEKVRDIFVFQCFTGIAYIDVANLTKDNIIEDGLEQKWIRLNRQKSSVQANIPLLEIPIAILEKYGNQKREKLLPMHTNQKMNEYLKEIAALCDINKRLTTHCGRHTFATVMLTKAS
ncbi:MAG: site-specific integrase [Dysgonamonadaceae bacterium]|jgi:site-specific recombinase XerD|nr:site-specific integrase [Dysgonamonadaceae bacterium]